ncbi:unnamed protein product [Urochloa humidicola]
MPSRCKYQFSVAVGHGYMLLFSLFGTLAIEPIMNSKDKRGVVESFLCMIHACLLSSFVWAMELSSEYMMELYDVKADIAQLHRCKYNYKKSHILTDRIAEIFVQPVNFVHLLIMGCHKGFVSKGPLLLMLHHPYDYDDEWVDARSSNHQDTFVMNILPWRFHSVKRDKLSIHFQNSWSLLVSEYRRSVESQFLALCHMSTYKLNWPPHILYNFKLLRTISVTSAEWLFSHSNGQIEISSVPTIKLAAVFLTILLVWCNDAAVQWKLHGTMLTLYGWQTNWGCIECFSCQWEPAAASNQLSGKTILLNRHTPRHIVLLLYLSQHLIIGQKYRWLQCSDSDFKMDFIYSQMESSGTPPVNDNDTTNNLNLLAAVHTLLIENADTLHHVKWASEIQGQTIDWL